MTIKEILRLCSLVLVLLSSFIAPACLAGLPDDVNKILELLNQKQYSGAFQFASDKLPEYEGEPDFDYAYGLAAQAAKKYHQAVFSFERVVKSKPEWVKARYALAASYYASGNLAAAKREFVFIKQLAQNEQYPLVNEYLAKIEQQQNQSSGHWQHQLRLGIGLDDNANSGIEDELIDTPVFGPITVFDSSQPIDDQFVLSQWQSIYSKPVNLNTRWYVLAGIRNSHYNEHSEMDRNYLDLFAGWQSRWRNINYQINGFYRPIWLDGEHYLTYYGAQGELDYDLKNNLTIGANLSLGEIDYQLHSQKDGDKLQWLMAIWLEKQVGKTISRMTLHAGDESVDKSAFDYLSRDYFGVQYRLSYLVTPQVKLSATLDYGRSDYQADHPLFLIKREDTLKKLAAELHYQYDKSWAGLFKLSYMENDSELALYQYDRTLAWFAVQYQF